MVTDRRCEPGSARAILRPVGVADEHSAVLSDTRMGNEEVEFRWGRYVDLLLLILRNYERSRRCLAVVVAPGDIELSKSA
jgi:hypothetical protein